MNDKPQRSTGEQFILLLLLSFAAMMLVQHFFPSNTNKAVKARADQPASTLAQAFAGIDAKQGPLLTRDQAVTEFTSLATQIKDNGDDAYSYWARLRSGLLQQYIIDPSHPEAAVVRYDAVKNHNAQDDIEAQAVYQEGDLLWAKEGKTSSAAATDLELLVHQGRGPSPLLHKQIYIPVGAAPASGPPLQGFDLKQVSDFSRDILERVNDYYKPTTFYIVFDKFFHWCGGNPSYSYGLAIIIFAIMTRVLMQPLSKKQYESMRGMQLIAPQMKKIQDRYKEKKEQASQMAMMKEIRELQAKHGVNPMLGCFLAILQMPIFYVVAYPLIQHNTAQMELAHASFLWVRSLAAPDIPLLVLYAISMFVSFRLSATPATDDTQRQQQMIMGFVMPFMFPFFLKNYPSAFTMYWMMYNLASTALQWRMMKSVDPSKDLVKSLFSNPAAAIEDLASKTISKDSEGGPKGADNGKKNKATAMPAEKAAPAGRKDAIPPRPGKNGTNGTAPAFNGRLSSEASENKGESEDEGEEEVAVGNAEKDKAGGRPTSGGSQRARRRRRY